MAEKQTTRMSKKDKPWLCSCGFLLGIVSPDSNILRIKYKDLYVSIEGKDVKVTQLCRRCATPNVLSSAETSTPPEEVPKEPIKKPAGAKTEEETKKTE